MNDEADPDYEQSLKRERDRIRLWEKTRQGRFEASMLHYDAPAEMSPQGDRAVDNTATFSDGGEGARRIYEAVDAAEAPTRKQLIDRAASIVGHHAPECLPTFYAVLRNGTNWRESVCELMKIWNATKTRQTRRHTRRNRKSPPKEAASTRRGNATRDKLKKC